MGRFSSVFLLLLAACGDNVVGDGAGPYPVDDVDPSGNATATPRYVPSVCGAQSWTTNITGDLSMNVSVASRADGAAVLATPRAGGSLTGFVLDTRMNMVSVNKIPIDGAFTQVVASVIGDRVVSTAIEHDAVHVHLLDNDLGDPHYTPKLPGSYLGEPAFYQAQADLVMPIAGDDGLWMHRFDSSFVVQDSIQLLATAPATSMTAAQMGVATLTAWSTANDECFMMLTSTFHPGPYAKLPVACDSPRLAVDRNTGDGVMVFDSADGVRMMDIAGTQLGVQSRLVRPDTRSPRALFDGANHWVSYLDARGDIIVGFLDADRKPVTMSLAHPKPEVGAYEMVLVDGSPWVFALGAEGYTAHRMCVDAQW